MMLIALTFAELGSSFSFMGGSVRYLQLSHGPLVGFTMGLDCLDFFDRCGAARNAGFSALR